MLELEKIRLQNIEAEEAILGAILLDPEAINQVADSLPAAAFSLVAHQEIYKAALALYAGGKPTDLMTVTTWLEDRKLLEKVGRQSKLAQLVDRTVSAVNIDQYAGLVVDKWMRRQLIHTAGDIGQTAQDTSQEIGDILDNAEQKIFSLTQERPQAGLVPISETLIDTFHSIETQQQGLALPGLASGFYDLDAITGGFQRSDLIILAGRPSMGKTALALGIARAIAATAPVAIFSLEMSKEQLVQRLLSSEAEIESNRLRSGKLRESEWAALSTALGELSEMPIFIDDAATLTVANIRSRCRRLHSTRSLGLVVVDYLQLMGAEGDTRQANRVAELAMISRGLKSLARELMVPVIALSQLSRSVESRNDKRPMMSDLRDSGALEQDADLVVMLYREEYYQPNTTDRGVAEAIITKHRNGPTGTVKLLFDSRLTKFKNLKR